MMFFEAAEKPAAEIPAIENEPAKKPAAEPDSKKPIKTLK
jgi:hypothetical protein